MLTDSIACLPVVFLCENNQGSYYRVSDIVKTFKLVTGKESAKLYTIFEYWGGIIIMGFIAFF